MIVINAGYLLSLLSVLVLATVQVCLQGVFVQLSSLPGPTPSLNGQPMLHVSVDPPEINLAAVDAILVRIIYTHSNIFFALPLAGVQLVRG